MADTKKQEKKQEADTESLFDPGDSLEEKKLKLELKIEEMKLGISITRRPLIWYGILPATILLLVIITIFIIIFFGNNPYVFGWSIFAIIALGVIFGILVIYFLINDINKDGSTSGFAGIDRIKTIIDIKEEIDKRKTQLRIVEGLIAHKRPEMVKLWDDSSILIRQYQVGAKRNRRMYYTLQITIIFCSLLVTGLTSGLTGLVTIFRTPWITPAISFSVSFLTALITLFRFRERGHNLQQTADAIEFEISCARRGIFGYKKLPEDDAYTKLAEEVERLINEQRKRQQQLEQSSDTKHTPETS